MTNKIPRKTVTRICKMLDLDPQKVSEIVISPLDVTVRWVIPIEGNSELRYEIECDCCARES